MRRVTIKEAATCLGLDEDVVQAQIKNGLLVACQDAEYKGYVWLKDAGEAPPAGKPRKKPPVQQPAPDPVEPPAEALAMPKPAEPPEKGRKPASKPETEERRPRTGQRTQEVQLLQEVVATLKEELSAKNKQLEIKDAEIQARREEVKGLLAVLQQNRALPVPPPTDQGLAHASPVSHGATLARPLAVDRLADGITKILLYFSRLVPRSQGKVSGSAKIRAGSEAGNAGLNGRSSESPGEAPYQAPDAVPSPESAIHHR